MLKEHYVNGLIFKCIRLALSLYVRFFPDTFPYETKRESFNIPAAGWHKNGWVLKEFDSPVTKIRHRYYINQSTKKGAPVFLFLHGLFLDGRNFLNLEHLNDTWTLVAYDFPERSDYYKGYMEDFSLIINDFLDCLKIKLIYLCGVSFGGGVSLKYTAYNQSRVKGLVLASTFVMNANPSDFSKNSELSRFIMKYPDGKLYWFLDKLFKRVFYGKNNPMHGVVEIIYLKHMDWYRQAVESITTLDGPEDSRFIECPVLVLHGNSDRTISFSKAKTISRYIPQAQLKVINKGTHAMVYLQGEMISQIIKEYFSV
ncbi:MAG: alpha/beta hydrolase [Chitinispirillaceae bacterium]|nr:alpha/beta hydrolase [Chitinispirillaceae bacterium]